MTKIKLTNDDKKSLKRILQDVSDQSNKYRLQAELESNKRTRKNLEHLRFECQEDFEVLEKLLIQIGLSDLL